MWSFRASCSRSSSAALLLSAALLAAGCPGAKDKDKAGDKDKAQAVSPLSIPMPESRKRLLTEMIKRRIISKDSASWNKSQEGVLRRMRIAEKRGALEMLSSRLGTLRGFAIEHQTKDGYTELWLTVPGYKKYHFLLSQEALDFFEKKGAEARFVFRIRTMKKKRIFDSLGLLTEEGTELYHRIKRNEAVFWKFPDGTVTGTVRPPKSRAAPVAAVPPPAPKRPGKKPSDVQALRQVSDLVSAGYVELSEPEVTFLLKTTRLSAERLQKESSLQIIPTKRKIYYLLSPSDPLMGVVGKYRSGSKGGLTGTPTMR